MKIHRKVFVLLLTVGCTLSLQAMQDRADEDIHVRSMPLINEAGSECPTTGVRVEQVTNRDTASNEQAGSQQEIVLSIPAQAVASKPNLKLYKLDSTAFAFEEFKELRNNNYQDRRAFSVVVARSDTLRFKVGFDSRQNQVEDLR